MTAGISENPYEFDQIMTRKMIRDMNWGIGDLIISFEHPVIVTQRKDELLTPKDAYHLDP